MPAAMRAAARAAVRPLLLCAALAIAAAVAPAAAQRSFVQTPEWVASILDATAPRPGVMQAPWRAIGPDRAPAEWQGPPPGPANGRGSQDSGRVRTILQSAEDPNTVFVVQGGGGLWKTNNFFAREPTWVPKSDALPTNGGSAALGATDRTVYLGIGDPFNGLNANTVSGLVARSLDGGDTWATPVLVDPEATAIWDMKVIADPTTPDRDVLLVGTDVGLFVSRDGGRSFTRVLGDSGANPILGNAAPFWSITRTAEGWLVAGRVNSQPGTPTQLWRSSADATQWVLLNVNFNNGGSRVGVYSVDGERVVFAVVGDGNWWVDVFRSDNSGTSFTGLNVLTPTRAFDGPAGVAGFNVNATCGGQAFYNMAFIIDPTDRTRNTFFFAGALCALGTTDNGRTITMRGFWFPGVGGVPGTIPYIHADGHAGAALRVPQASQSPGATLRARLGLTAADGDAGVMGAHGHHSRHAKKKKCGKRHDCDDEPKGSPSPSPVASPALPSPSPAQPSPSPAQPSPSPAQPSPSPAQPSPSPALPSPSPAPAEQVALVFGTDGGLFVSRDNGLTWDDSKNVGIATMLIYSLASTPLNRDLVTLGLQDNGMRVRIRASSAYGQASTGDGMDMIMSQAGALNDGCWIYGVNFGEFEPDNWVLGSVDAASKSANFNDLVRKQVAVPLPGKGNPSFAVPDARGDPSGQTVYARTDSGLFRSDNCGESWRRLGALARVAQEEPIPDGQSQTLHTIVVAHGTKEIMAATTPANRVYVFDTDVQSKSADLTLAAAWAGPQPQWTGTTTPAWSRSNARLYVASAAEPGSTDRRRVAFADATQAGSALTFTICASAGLIDTPITQMVIDPDTNFMYAGTWAGVYRSTDACASWAPFNAGMPNVQVRALSLLPGSPKLLRAGTYGRSAFEVQL